MFKKFSGKSAIIGVMLIGALGFAQASLAESDNDNWLQQQLSSTDGNPGPGFDQSGVKDNSTVKSRSENVSGWLEQQLRVTDGNPGIAS
ncbi:MAG: hypothetical protein ACREUV_03075 [Burkholderiales bacterium]